MLKKLFNKFKKSAPIPEEDLPLGLFAAIEHFVKGAGIPLMGAAAQKAFSVATNPNSEPRDFVTVLESDEALASRVLRIANSVYFSRGVQIKKLEDAVVTIGVNELRGLFNASTVSQLFPVKHPLREIIWKNSLQTATLAKEFCQLFDINDADFAFLAGLMHDLGKLYLIKNATSQYEKAAKLVSQDGIGYAQAELEYFAFTHNEIGQYIAAQWNFSKDLIRCIRFHHESPENLWNAGTGFRASLLIQFSDSLSHIILQKSHDSQTTPFAAHNQTVLKSILERIGSAEHSVEILSQQAEKLIRKTQSDTLMWDDDI